MEDFEIELRRAKNAVIAHDYNLAIRLYKAMLEKAPENQELLSSLGDLYVKSNDNNKALECYQKILQSSPEDFNALNSIGGICRRLGKFDDSVEILKKALATGVNNAEANYNLGFTYKFMGKNDEAIECFENVIAANPSDVLAYNHLGSIYASQNNHDKAISTYKLGLQVDPNHPILLFNLAKSCRAIHDDGAALAAYEGTLRAKPGWQEAVLEYSDMLLEKRKSKMAGEQVQNAIGLHPKDSSLYVQLAKIFANQNNYEKAASSYEIANRLSCAEVRSLGNARILSDLAVCRSELNNTEESVKVAKQALSLDPKDGYVLKNAASVFLSASQTEQSADAIATLSEQNPNDVETLDLIAQQSIVENHDPQSEVIAQKIKGLDSNYVNFYYNFAKRYAQVQNYTEAEKYVQLFIDEKMKDVHAWILSGKIAEAQGDTSKAYDAYSTALAFDPNNFFAQKMSDKLEPEVQAAESSAGDNSAGAEMLAGSEEISLDDFGFGDDEPTESEESANTAQSEPVVVVEATASEPIAEAEVEVSSDFSDDGTDIFKLDDDTSLFETSEADSDLVEPEDTSDGLEAPVTEEALAETDSTVEDGLGSTSDEPSSSDEALDSDDEELSLDNTEPSDSLTSALDSVDLPEDEAPVEKPKVEKPTEQELPSDEPVSSEPEQIPDVSLDSLLDGTSQIELEDAAESEEELSEPTNNELEPETADIVVEISVPEEEAPATEPEPELDVQNEAAYDNFVGQMEDMLPRLSNMIENPQDAEQFKKEISMFHRLRDLGELLPFEEREKFLSGKIRLLLDYIIARLSGKKGLLQTASDLRRADGLPEIADCPMTEDVKKSEVTDVIKNLENLTYFLQDQNLAKALKMSAAELEEKL